LVPLLSEEFQVALQRSFGLPLTVLAGHVCEKIRNHASSAHCSVDKYGHNPQPLLSEEFQVALQRSFGLPLTVLAGHVGEKIRNHASSAHCSVGKYCGFAI
jgi:hypothetical protein